MRLFTKAFAALTAGLLVGAPTLSAQGAEFALGGGVGIPLGAFDDAAKIGWHGLAAVSFPMSGPSVFRSMGNTSSTSSTDRRR